MSADLFDAFGAQSLDDGDRNLAQKASGQNNSIYNLPVQQDLGATSRDHALVEDDDDFGDFEGEVPTKEYSRDTADWSDRLEFQHGALQDDAPPIRKPRTKATKDPNVLFDAEDSMSEEDEGLDDDFGDFEDSEPQPAHPRSQATIVPSRPAVNTEQDLLGSFNEPMKQEQQSQSTNVAPANTLKVKSTPTKKAPIPMQVTRTSTAESNDTWDDFTTTDVPEATPHTMTSTSLPTSILDSMSVPAPSPPPLCPSNIPPPSVLLPLFPPILSEISTSVLQPFLALPSASRTPSPSLRTFLTSHQNLLQVLAHVIAGRKHRWRRDKRLAAATRIGPGGGLKLAGLDKAEPAREDAQVDEVLRAVRMHVGPLRAVVGAVNAAGGSVGAVPDLAGVMPVRTATSAEGAVVGTVACGLCGLKREERVAKFDVEVLDSFGEWWIEKTNMHLGCWRFWEGFKHRLGQR